MTTEKALVCLGDALRQKLILSIDSKLPIRSRFSIPAGDSIVAS